MEKFILKNVTFKVGETTFFAEEMIIYDSSLKKEISEKIEETSSDDLLKERNSILSEESLKTIQIDDYPLNRCKNPNCNKLAPLNHQFCSRDCFQIYRKIKKEKEGNIDYGTFKCSNCGREQKRRYINQKFCDMKCSGEYRSKIYQEQKKQKLLLEQGFKKYSPSQEEKVDLVEEPKKLILIILIQ